MDVPSPLIKSVDCSCSSSVLLVASPGFQGGRISDGFGPLGLQAGPPCDLCNHTRLRRTGACFNAC